MLDGLTVSPTSSSSSTVPRPRRFSVLFFFVFFLRNHLVTVGMQVLVLHILLLLDSLLAVKPLKA